MKNAALFIWIPFTLFFSVVEATDTLLVPQLHPASATAYDIDQGLPVSCLRKVIGDSKGRIWINPCNSYDIYQGVSFFQFDGNQSNTVELDASGISNGSQIWYLFGITSGDIIFGSNRDSVLCFLFNPNTNEQSIYSFSEGEFVRNIVSGGENNMYAITETPNTYEIYLLTFEQKIKLTSIEITPDQRRYYTGPIPTILTDRTLWFLHRNKGFMGYSIDHNTTKKYDWLALFGKEKNVYPAIGSGGGDFELMTDAKGNLLFYIQEYHQFYVFQPNNEIFQPYQLLNKSASILNFSYDKHIVFNKDEEGNILISMSLVSSQLLDFENYQTLLIDQEGTIFDYSTIAKMSMTGRYGRAFGDSFFSKNFKKNILIATGGGLIAVDIQADLGIKTGINGRGTRSIAALGKDKVIVITDGDLKATLDLKTLKSEKITPQSVLYPFQQTISLGQVISRGEDELWFGMEGSIKKLTCFNRKSKEFRSYPIEKFYRKFNFIHEEKIIFISGEHEVYTYHFDKNELVSFGTDETPLDITAEANEIYVGENQIIWIASLNGLWRLDPTTNSSLRLGEEEGFADARVMCINEAEDGKLWLGTFGGVHIYDPQTGKIKIIDESQGLSNNTVVGILTDAEGDRWVSTFDGITVLSSDGKVLFELSEKDGIAHRESNRYSYYKTPDGKLIFGSVSGVSILDPLKIKGQLMQKEKLLLYATDLSFFDRQKGKVVRLTYGLDRIDRLELPPTNRFLEIDFGLSYYVNPERSAFSYHIDREDQSQLQLDDIWTNIGSTSRLVLNDLPIGTYDILIRGMNAKGQWADSPIVIPIHITEFFYKTWWFYVLCSLPILLVAFFWIRRLQTERIRLEEEVRVRTYQIVQDKALIEEQADKLKEMDEVKSRFFTNISHEFRTPLTVINGMAEEISRDPEKWAQEGSELIQRNGKNLLSLINQILELRKLESGKLSLQNIQGDIIPYLSYLFESVKSLAESKQQHLSFSSDPETLQMDYDPEKLQRIVFNLLSNAIKFTPKGGKVSMKTKLKETHPQDQLVLEISDTGKGISSDKLPYIFDRFEQGDNFLTHTEEGTGIGLALTQELVKLMEGEITAVSAPKLGSTFTVLLPITQKAPIQNIDATSDESDLAIPAITVFDEIEQTEVFTSDRNTSKPSLLIVEDNRDVAQYLKICLSHSYQIIHAKDGQEGIEKALESVPDIIISDVMMPRKDGFELCQTLKLDERTSHVPIILLTAKADMASRISGLRRGADVYLKKPFNREELEVSLNQLITLRKRLQARYQGLDAPAPTSDPGLQIEDAFIGKIREAVHENLSDEKFGIEELSETMNMSRSSLHKKIKALTNRTPAIFIRSIRLHHAKELLSNTDLNITQVAYEVGFEDSSYFARCFSKEFGVTPRQFRK